MGSGRMEMLKQGGSGAVEGGGVKGRTGPNGESDKTYGNLLSHNQNKTKPNSARILSRSHEKRKGKGAKS